MLAALSNELKPGKQLEAHPTAVIFWVLTVITTILAPVLWLMSRPEWMVVSWTAGALWLNLIAGAWCKILWPDWETQDREPAPAGERQRQPMNPNYTRQRGDSARRIIHPSPSIVRMQPGAAIALRQGSVRWFRQGSSGKNP